MCIGLKLCSKKNCIEQERCLFPEEKVKKKAKVNQCQLNKKFCTNSRACEILGQCILDHPLVKKDKQATKQLRKQMDINSVVKIITRLMPSLNKPRKKVHGKPKP
jgi:hypothetical protein